MVLANVLLSVLATGFVCATRIALVIWCLDDVGALFLTDELASNDDEEGDDERSRHRSNENKMSDGGRGRASPPIGVWKSSQKWNAQRSAVRSIAWLGLLVATVVLSLQ